MTEYRRTWHPGATWFFTVNLAERRGNRLLVERIDALRTAFRNVRARHPFRVNEAYGGDVSGNISSAIKLTSTVTWITSIGTQ